jgi:DNA-binding transcriptional LysR family regulator
MDLNEVSVFVKVVEAGSFVSAAKQLEMPKSTVSAKVSALERRLGVTLIRRTTRRLFVTDVGQEYYNQCLQALQQIGAAEDQIGQRQSVPQGLLRITAPVELGVILLPMVLSEFQKLYPAVNVEVILTDKTVDLVSEGIDLAIRAGDLKDSTLISKKLGSVYFALFASPKYLKSAGTPKSPKELKDHCCIQFTPLGANGWQLHGPRGAQVISLNKHMLINDLNLIKTLTVAGVGIALLPTFFCYSDTEERRLVRILGDWRTSVHPVHIVYPHQKFVPMKLKAFLNLASEIIRPSLEEYRL